MHSLRLLHRPIVITDISSHKKSLSFACPDGTVSVTHSGQCDRIVSYRLTSLNYPIAVSNILARSRLRRCAMDGNTGLPIAGKTCSVCGTWYDASEYSYGRRSNRSYCRTCNRLEKAAYRKGGVAAAEQFRNEQRATWKDSTGRG